MFSPGEKRHGSNLNLCGFFFICLRVIAGREPLQSLQSPRMVVGIGEELKVLPKLVVAVVAAVFDSRSLIVRFMRST